MAKKKPFQAKVKAPKRITISTIAKAADVSAGLVSSFFSGRDYSESGKSGIRIGEATAQRIRDVCRELKYVPERASAYNRIYPELGEIALAGNSALSFHVNRFYSMILDGVIEGGNASTTKISLQQFETEIDYLKNPELLPRGVREGDIRKFILVGEPNISFVKALLLHDVRVVYLSRFVDVPGVVSIVPDYAEAASITVNYLAGLGHSVIGFTALAYFKNAWHGDELIRGASHSMAHLGIPFEPNDFQFADPDLKSAVLKLVRRKSRRPTAIFAFDDLSADYAIQALTAEGLKVPGDISIVGCNDDRMAASASHPLSTIHLPVTQMGARAVAAINKLATEPIADSPKRITLPVYLVERSTSAPPAK